MKLYNKTWCFKSVQVVRPFLTFSSVRWGWTLMAIAVIEVAILENKLRFLFKVNVWTVLWDKNNGCCRKVAISGGSTS